MHLGKVTLKNYRCFDAIEIELHPRLTVLVAENGGGKTAVLDAISVGFSPVLRYLSSADQRLPAHGMKDTDYRLIPSMGRGNEERWVASDYAQVTMETTDGLRWDYWRGSSKDKKPESRVGQSDLSNYLTSVLESTKRNLPQLLPVFAYYGAQRGWIIIPERLHSKSNVDYTQPTSALYGALDSISEFKEMMKWFDSEEAAELRRNKGRSNEEFEESRILSAVRSTVETLLGGAYRNPHFDRRHKFVVESSSGPVALQVSQLSQGYQSMLALGMDFARRLAIANPHLSSDSNFGSDSARQYIEKWHPGGLQEISRRGPSWAPAIMLVDEIDLHLHPRWQQRVLGDLMRSFPCTQFIVTTHSPQILTTLRKENIRILEHDDDEGWKSRTPEHSPLAREPGDALAFIMDTHPRPEPDVLRDLETLEQLARNGEFASEKANELRERLRATGYELSDQEKDLFQVLSENASDYGKGGRRG